MQCLIKAAVIAAALVASAAADAASFDFSYTFTDGQKLTGSLDGTLTGTIISDISNLHVALNGIAFQGGLDGNGQSTTLGIYGYDPVSAAFGTLAPVFSTVASQNNFGIFDLDPSADVANYEFAFTNDPSTGALVVANNFLAPNGGALAIDPDLSGAYGSWTVTPVPLPAALPLLLSGLGLCGAFRRRRA